MGLYDTIQASFPLLLFSFSSGELDWLGCTGGSSSFILVSARASWLWRRKQQDLIQWLSDSPLLPAFSFNRSVLSSPLQGLGSAP